MISHRSLNRVDPGNLLILLLLLLLLLLDVLVEHGLDNRFDVRVVVMHILACGSIHLNRDTLAIQWHRLTLQGLDVV